MSAVPQRSPLQLRAMNQRDVTAVMAIETRAYAFPWTEAIIRGCLRAGYHCRVLEIDGEIEAYGVMSSGANEAHLLNLCVRPEAWGQGLARHLLDHLLAMAEGQGARTLFLEVRPTNMRALRLYAKAGLCEIGLRRGYYPAAQGREDALVMAKEINPGSGPRSG